MEKLLQFKTNDEFNYNYVLCTTPYGKYNIKDINDVLNIIKQSLESDKCLGLCETFDENANQIINFDLDISLKEKTTITIEEIRLFIKVCNTVFQKFLKVPKSDFTCYVLSKHDFQSNIEWKKDNLHFGVHIIYPHIVLDLENRKKFYYIILEECKKKNTFDILPLLHKNYNYILDECFINKSPIMVYGARKMNQSHYKVRYRVEFNLDTTPVVEHESLNFDSYFDLFSLNTQREVTEINFNNFPVILNSELLISEKDKKKNKTKKNLENYSEFSEYDKLKKLTSMLSEERADSYDKWILVGLCLHNISSSEECLKIFETFSLKSESKKNRTNFKKLWKSFRKRNDGLNMGTLRYWVSRDNPEEFQKFRNEEIDKKISLTIKEDWNTPYDIAKVLKELYDDIYVCSNISKNHWYEFNNHRWNKMESGFKLFLNISDELVSFYKNKVKDIRRKEVEIDEKNEDDEKMSIQEKREILSQKKGNIEKIIKKLKVTSFKRSLMEECRNLFYDPKFIEKLDEVSRNLMCFNNGVYDFDSLTFRDGNPHDYISYTTGIDYIEYSETNPDIEKVYNIFKEMQDSKEKTDYFFTSMSLGLHGVKLDQRIDFWTGTGSNGKSLTVDFLQRSFGDYFYSPSITILTMKRKSSSNPSPDIMKIKGRRFIVFQEPEHDDQIYTGLMKSLFGNDMICGRYLHENEVSFKPQASGFLACNDLPNISSQDGGTWRRIHVLHFPFKFVLREPKDRSEKRGDPKLCDEIENLKEAFASTLVKYYKDHVILNNSKIIEPFDVTQNTNQYRRACDIYEDFMKDNIVDSEGDKLEFLTVFQSFVQWSKDVCNLSKIPKKNEVKRQMENRFGKLVNGKFWNNKKFLTL